MSRKFSKITTYLAALLFAIVCSPVTGQELVSFTGATMGTRYTVTIAKRDDIAELQKSVDALLVKINKQMSTYDSNSELSRFNRSTGTNWFTVSSETATVVAFALQVAQESGGAFDPTIGPVVNLWGFGPEGRRKEPPSEAAIAKALKRVGYKKLAVRMNPPALRKEISSIYVDLSAVAKGFAVDEISKFLKSANCPQSLVVIGGDIRANGVKPDGSPWRIGIESPDGAGKAVERKVPLRNMAVSTSGDWNNSFSHEGKRYSHVIDPRTGRPVPHTLASVTVFAGQSMQADCWDTMLLVLGEEQGLKWCGKHDVAAMFFSRHPDGTIGVRESQSVAKLLSR